MNQVWRCLPRNNGERGASAVEYGLMTAAIAAIVVGVVLVLGQFVSARLTETCVNIAITDGGDPAACDDTGGSGAE
jgi:pilus assembly protein Flp/PilA